MAERFHLGTFLWGLVLAMVGTVYFGEGVGWWEVDFLRFRYVGPLVLILVGTIVLAGAMARRAGDDQPGTPG